VYPHACVASVRKHDMGRWSVSAVFPTDSIHCKPVRTQATDGAKDLSPHIGFEVKSMPTLYVGIDVSKDKFDACAKNESGDVEMPSRSYENNLDGMKKFEADIDKVKPKYSMIIIGLEATGVYHRNLLNRMIADGFQVKEFNPLELAGLKNSRIRKTKTDKIDSEIICDGVRLYSMTNTSKYLNEENYLEMRENAMIYHRLTEYLALIKTRVRTCLIQLCPGYEKNFKDILGKSSQQILKKTMKIVNTFSISEEEINMILEKNYPTTKPMISKAKSIKKSFDDSICPKFRKDPLVREVKILLEQYELMYDQRKRIEARIDKLMKDLNPKILSIPGIGTISGAMILGCIGNVNRFKDGKSLVAFSGLDPSINQSGLSSKNGHISKRGNKYLRRYLDNAVLVAIKFNPVIKDTYSRLRSKGKTHRTAAMACARKLLMIVYSVEKNQKNFFVPSYLQTS
jgi:transposase